MRITISVYTHSTKLGKIVYKTKTIGASTDVLVCSTTMELIDKLKKKVERLETLKQTEDKRQLKLPFKERK